MEAMISYGQSAPIVLQPVIERLASMIRLSIALYDLQTSVSSFHCQMPICFIRPMLLVPNNESIANSPSVGNRGINSLYKAQADYYHLYNIPICKFL